MQIFGADSLRTHGDGLVVAVIGNGPSAPECREHLREANLVVRCNNWNRRKNYDPDVTGRRCEILFNTFDCNPAVGKEGFPIPKDVVIAIPSPFHMDRVSKCSGQWYPDSRVLMVNPYVNKMACQALELRSEGWKHPIPTVGFTILFHLARIREIAPGVIRRIYITGFDWQVNKQAETVGRIPVSSNRLPVNYNHSYLREFKWVCKHLWGDALYDFDGPAADVLAWGQRF